MVANQLNRALRYFNTVRYLKPIQIAWRFRPKPKLNQSRPLPQDRPTTTDAWAKPCEATPSLLSEKHHVYLNQPGDVVHSQDWNDHSKPLLWLYNLHYFADLNAEEAAERRSWHRSLIARWIDENPPTVGVGWAPFPTSLRTVNWIKWALAGNALEEDWRSSLALQVRYLHQSLEYHLLGNHLLANAKALVFAGCFFSGEEAEEWLHKGLGILKHEYSEQILSDGGHFELSPMYQLLCIEDILDLINLASVYADTLEQGQVAVWRDLAAKMLQWSHVMTHPDGELAFFNDATPGVAPQFGTLVTYANKLGVTLKTRLSSNTHLDASGFIRLENASVATILDVGHVGAPYIPGHGHADTLAFELSAFGRRVIVNTGISTYASDGRRAYERSTAAHSTVEIDGESSSEVWHAFRVARRASPYGLDIESSDLETKVACSHDGYLRLKGKPTHTRTWNLKSHELTITDELGGSFQSAKSRLYLHPNVAARAVSRERLLLELPGLPAINMDIEATSFAVETAYWCAGFGKTMPTSVIVLTLNSARSTTRLAW